MSQQIDYEVDNWKKWNDAHPGEEAPSNDPADTTPTTPDGQDPTPGPT
jgi:hypothetical protein